MNKKIRSIGSTGLLSLALLAMVIIATGTGAMQVSPGQVVAILLKQVGISLPVTYDESMEGVLWSIRLPRVVLAVLVGAGLALAGAALQGLFRNPLADPSLIGVSSGASLTTVMMIVLQSAIPFLQFNGVLGFYALNIATFIGAALAVLFVFRISAYGRTTQMTTMLLAGIAVNALCNAITSMMTYLSSNEQLRSIAFWTMGSLGGASWQTVLAVLPFILIPAVMLPRMGQALNVFALGEREAMHSGVKVGRLKTQLVIYSTMAVAAGVAVAGIISFIGLVVPHIVRQFTGADHRLLIPCSAITGAILLTGADLLCRTVVAPAELPVGIVTAIIGAPFFIWLIIKEKRTTAI
ncbi:iron ABC transporter permease [Chitinophaga pendula]|uniref:FecCD family ABC transporter permease n=1 Tax=Chitinophaga TaxID=79328 RepID=UPI000BAF1DB6|nr:MULTISPECIES: iron ABC transporter permease [Chitinophaga]ASZ09733.1 Fe3+-siderophore ABC transporter permease [Chitinophaga sp. MD30]UCJ07324.1 iron ABC transporter permease [Chitinophaga pendula]